MRDPLKPPFDHNKTSSGSIRSDGAAGDGEKETARILSCENVHFLIRVALGVVLNETVNRLRGHTLKPRQGLGSCVCVRVRVFIALQN